MISSYVVNILLILMTYKKNHIHEKILIYIKVVSIINYFINNIILEILFCLKIIVYNKFNIIINF